MRRRGIVFGQRPSPERITLTNRLPSQIIYEYYANSNVPNTTEMTIHIPDEPRRNTNLESIDESLQRLFDALIRDMNRTNNTINIDPADYRKIKIDTDYDVEFIEELHFDDGIAPAMLLTALTKYKFEPKFSPTLDTLMSFPLCDKVVTIVPEKFAEAKKRVAELYDVDTTPNTMMVVETEKEVRVFDVISKGDSRRVFEAGYECEDIKGNQVLCTREGYLSLVSSKTIEFNGATFKRVGSGKYVLVDGDVYDTTPPFGRFLFRKFRALLLIKKHPVVKKVGHTILQTYTLGIMTPFIFDYGEGIRTFEDTLGMMNAVITEDEVTGRVLPIFGDEDVIRKYYGEIFDDLLIEDFVPFPFRRSHLDTLSVDAKNSSLLITNGITIKVRPLVKYKTLRGDGV